MTQTSATTDANNSSRTVDGVDIREAVARTGRRPAGGDATSACTSTSGR
jgi:hypothetical protein